MLNFGGVPILHTMFTISGGSEPTDSVAFTALVVVGAGGFMAGQPTPSLTHPPQK